MKDVSESNERSKEQKKSLKYEKKENPLNSIEFEDYREIDGCRDAYINHTNADYEGHSEEYYEWN